MAKDKGKKEKKKPKKAKVPAAGFTTLELLLVLIILGIIGYVGYYVNHSRNTTNALNASSANTQVAVKASASPTANWQTIKSADGSYTFKAPAGWVSLTCDDGAAVYLASSQANLAKCQSDNTGEITFSVRADQSAKNPIAHDSSFQTYATESLTVNKVKGNKTTYKTSTDPGIGRDTTYVSYGFLSGGKSFYASFTEQSQYPVTDLATFDQIVQTWKF